MAANTAVFEMWDRESRLYDRYTTNAAELLNSEKPLRAAKAEWERFFLASHGDVFQRLDLEEPRERLFVDTLYYDFVVDQLIDLVERRFGVRLRNRESTANTDALSFEFRSLHEAVIDTDAIGRRLDARLETADLLSADVSVLRDLYERIVPRDVRLRLGEYYTPRGVAELSVGDLPIDDYASETVLDPGCGSGAFLAACVDEKRRALEDDLAPAALVDAITDTVFGIDLNPAAVKSAKLGYLLALGSLLDADDVESLEIPVFLTDALGLTRDDEIRFDGAPVSLTVDHVVGNPPWITWGNLTDAVKDAWREEYVAELDLLPHGGVESRLGHANDDISLLFVWACIDRYLADGGTASFVLKRDILTGPAGKLLRTQSVNGRPVAVDHVHDFNGLRPFGPDVDVDAAIYTLRADESPEFPISADSWTSGDDRPRFSSAESIRETLNREKTGFIPVLDDDPSSSWVRSDIENRALGDCVHRIRHGVKDDAKAVFDLDRSQLDELEHDHVYPYIKSKHVVKYGLFGHGLHLVPITAAGEDNEAELRRTCPETYDYLDSHRGALESRSSSWLENGTFYNVFGLGEYTWSDYKVVWCRLGFKPHFAVVSTVDDDDLGEKTAVPSDHCMFISTDDEHEAHFLCALLNSAIYQRTIRDIASGGKASLSKTLVSKLNLPEYEGGGAQTRLAELSMAAHDIVPEHTDVGKRTYNATTIDELAVVQAQIDELVEKLLSERPSRSTVE